MNPDSQTISLAELITIFLITPTPKPIKQGYFSDYQLKAYATAAILCELIMQNKLRLDMGLIRTVDSSKVGIDFFDIVTKRISINRQFKDLKYWIDYLSDFEYPHNTKEKFELLEKVNVVLEQRGLVKLEYGRFLIIFSRTIVIPTDYASKYIDSMVEELQDQAFDGPKGNRLLYLAITLSTKFSSRLTAYLSEEKAIEIEKKLDNPEFIQKHSQVFELTDSIHKAYYGS